MTWQPAAIRYPDVELVLTNYLRDALVAASETGVYVSDTIPNPRHLRMVIVRRDGGPVGELRDQARVSLRIWDTTEQKANDLARLVQALVSAAPDGAPILQVIHQSGPTPVADESGAALRYLVVEVHTRGVELP